MSNALDVPFVRGNTWDCGQRQDLRGEHQLQRCFENRGELDADVAFYGINYDSQRHCEIPLGAPYDPPGYVDTCSTGPLKYGFNGEFCITNVVSRPAESLPPICQNGLAPKRIGRAVDYYGRSRIQWQCLPT